LATFFMAAFLAATFVAGFRRAVVFLLERFAVVAIICSCC